MGSEFLHLTNLQNDANTDPQTILKAARLQTISIFIISVSPHIGGCRVGSVAQC